MMASQTLSDAFLPALGGAAFPAPAFGNGRSVGRSRAFSSPPYSFAQLFIFVSMDAWLFIL